MLGIVLAFALSSNANVSPTAPQSFFLGTEAGRAFHGDNTSHVFIGPYAGFIWKGDERICPLFILNDSHGDPLVIIDRRGIVRRRQSYRKIREAFANYRMFRKVGE